MLLSEAGSRASTNRTPLVEIALALGFALLFALSPLSASGRLALSAVVGLAFGVVFFAYRWLVHRSSSWNPNSEANAVASVRSDVDPLATWGAGALVVALFLPTLIDLYPWYTESVWRNGHGLFVPLLAFAIARIAIRDHREMPVEGSAWGLAFLVPGLLLAIVDAGVHSIYFAVLAMPLVVTGLILVSFGPGWSRILAVPTLMLLFFVPIPSGVATVLGFDVGSATVAQWFIQLLGRPVTREGVLLFVDMGDGYGISSRCSGFSILYGALALAVAIGAVVGSWKRTLALALCALPLTILANGARAAMLIVVCEWLNVDPSRTMAHGMSGIAAYLAVMVAMFILGGREARVRLVAQ